MKSEILQVIDRASERALHMQRFERQSLVVWNLADVRVKILQQRSAFVRDRVVPRLTLGDACPATWQIGVCPACTRLGKITPVIGVVTPRAAFAEGLFRNRASLLLYSASGRQHLQSPMQSAFIEDFPAKSNRADRDKPNCWAGVLTLAMRVQIVIKHCRSCGVPTGLRYLTPWLARACHLPYLRALSSFWIILLLVSGRTAMDGTDPHDATVKGLAQAGHIDGTASPDGRV
jgi:hypothetical protein